MNKRWFFVAAATVLLGLSGTAFVRAGTTYSSNNNGCPPKAPDCGCRVLDICGRVLDCGTGTAVSGDEICLVDSSRSCVLTTTTAADGTFHFSTDCFPEGYYVVEDRTNSQLLGRLDKNGSVTFIWVIVDENSDGTIDRTDLVASDGTGELNFVGLNCKGGRFPEEGKDPFPVTALKPLSAKH